MIRIPMKIDSTDRGAPIQINFLQHYRQVIQTVLNNDFIFFSSNPFGLNTSHSLSDMSGNNVHFM